MFHALEIVGEIAASIIGSVIAAHIIETKLGDNTSSPATVTPQQIYSWAQTAAGHNYFQRLLCGFDMSLNVIFGGNLYETISSRTSRWVRNKNPEFFLWRAISTWIIWLCDIVQKMHGVKAQSGDIVRNVEVINLELVSLGLPPLDLKKILGLV